MRSDELFRESYKAPVAKSVGAAPK